jgi:hypothetical protein
MLGPAGAANHSAAFTVPEAQIASVKSKIQCEIATGDFQSSENQLHRPRTDVLPA